MPKRVDHEVRRREIAEAVWRIAAGRGLPAATLREVAAEAGVSMRLVQYYFDTKERLLVGALDLLTREFGERMRQRFAALGRPATPQEFMRIVLLEVLPTDERGLMMSRVQSAYFAAALTDPVLAATARSADDTMPQQALESVLSAQLHRAVEAGEVAADIDVLMEARELGALAAGLASMIVVGARTPAEAVDVVSYRLDCLFRSR
ncbi:TetR/AcrR family transcriptional regulator [Actinoplanes sp. N902-109]|uniref:TetR/AcrR family transcriptional regulator n=1 Tax=Actinoplanes sp. (strain N902-109) TaxID=649831 RepID=UPI0005A17CF4|nr:TetR/AcrR family transcriptional regulator [Actinoplanes sp. N902-109]